MTEQTFTIKQINAVFSGDCDHLTCYELREKLTRLAYVPQEGEVYAWQLQNDTADCYTKRRAEHTLSPLHDRRPLSWDEVPWAKVLRDGLIKVMDLTSNQRMADAQDALDACAKMRGESE
jgi:hypothetical protein